MYNNFASKTSGKQHQQSEQQQVAVLLNQVRISYLDQEVTLGTQCEQIAFDTTGFVAAQENEAVFFKWVDKAFSK